MLRTFHEWLVYIPLGVGADLSRPYMFVVVSWLGIRCVRVCLCRFVVVNVYAGTMNRCIRLVFVAYMVGIGLLYYIEYFAKCVADNYEMRCEHSTNGWCTFR